MGRAFKTWEFYAIFIILMIAGYYILKFINIIPEVFPEAQPWDVVVWVSGIALTVVGIAIAIFSALAWTQSRENKKSFIGELRKLQQEIHTFSGKMDENFKRDMGLRTDHEDLKNGHLLLKRKVEEHEKKIDSNTDRIQEIEKKISLK